MNKDKVPQAGKLTDTSPNQLIDYLETLTTLKDIPVIVIRLLVEYVPYLSDSLVLNQRLTKQLCKWARISTFKRLYRASEDGFDRKLMTQCVVNQGPTIIVASTKFGYVIAGYKSRSWTFDRSYTFETDKHSFLCSTRMTDGRDFVLYPVRDPDKAFIRSMQNDALRFGHGDLNIPFICRCSGYSCNTSNLAWSILSAYGDDWVEPDISLGSVRFGAFEMCELEIFAVC